MLVDAVFRTNICLRRAKMTNWYFRASLECVFAVTIARSSGENEISMQGSCSEASSVARVSHVPSTL